MDRSTRKSQKSKLTRRGIIRQRFLIKKNHLLHLLILERGKMCNEVDCAFLDQDQNVKVRPLGEITTQKKPILWSIQYIIANSSLKLVQGRKVNGSWPPQAHGCVSKLMTLQYVMWLPRKAILVKIWWKPNPERGVLTTRSSCSVPPPSDSKELSVNISELPDHAELLNVYPFYFEKDGS